VEIYAAGAVRFLFRYNLFAGNPDQLRTERFVCTTDNMPGSATHEILDEFKTGAYGIETASPMGLNDCVACHLDVTREFCDDVGLEIANWDSILN